MDSDGDLDLVTSGYYGTGYELNYYINDGTGDFGNPIPFGVITGAQSSLEYADFDSDGDIDLINCGNARLDYYTNNGNGGFNGPKAFGYS